MLKQSMITKPEKVAAKVPKSLKSIDATTIFQSLNTPYLVVSADDPDFTIIARNEAYARLGTNQDNEIIGRPLRDVMPATSDVLREIG